jgi:hypothetical protein
MRMQPSEAVYLKTNVKSPGFKATPIQSELEVNYDSRFFAHQKESNPDAYTRLILDVLRGKHAAFVRDDELRRAWEIFTPLLDQIERENIQPILYEQGTRGPKEADDFIFENGGYIRNDNYIFYDGSVCKKPDDGCASIPVNHGPNVTSDESDICDIGVYGLDEMGQNFALDLAKHGFKVCVSSQTNSDMETTVLRAKEKGNLPIVGAKEPHDLIASLKRPRKVVVFGLAGKSLDHTITALARYMEIGDIL